jgi:hypothetical protein
MIEENYQSMNYLPCSTQAEETLSKASFSVLYIRASLNHLLGDVLTVVDASIQDTIQRKAIKDLVKRKFWDAMNNMEDEKDQPVLPLPVVGSA